MLKYQLLGSTDFGTNNIRGVGQHALINSVIKCGYKCAPRGIPTYETLGVTYNYPLGEVETREGGNPAIGIVEGVGLISSAKWEDVLKALCLVAPKTVEQGMFAGTMSDYAGRLAGFPFNINNYLDLTSRQAIGIISRHGEIGKDLPCTTSVQLRERDGRLHINVAMRSQDLFIGLPSDVLMWTLLGLYVCAVRSLMPGHLIFQVSAPHVYEKHAKRIDETIKTWKYEWGPLPLISRDELGNQLKEAKGKNWMPAGLTRS